MIAVQIQIRRSFWGNSLTESVQSYLKELEETKSSLEGVWIKGVHGDVVDAVFNEKLAKATREVIDEEIKLCQFYNEYQDRQANDLNLSQWVFVKQEEAKPKYGWQPVPGEQWVKANGRVKAIIQFDRSGIMVKLTLSYKNDSNALHFFEVNRYSPQNTPTAHLKSETSIENTVADFKKQADEFLEKHLFPLYSTEEHNTFKQLLCLES